MRAARLGPGAREALAPERLHPDHRSDHRAVDVEVPGRNPARDLGPRLWAWIEGYGKIAVPGDYGNVNSYMWIPIVGPIIGGILGGTMYDWFVGDVLKSRGVPPDVSVEEVGETEIERPGRAEPTGGYAAGGQEPPGRVPRPPEGGGGTTGGTP